MASTRTDSQLLDHLAKMQLVDVRSRAVRKLGYDPTTRMAAVQFQGSEALYGYPNLTPDEVAGWLEVMEDHRSIGEFVTTVIKARHDFEHVRLDRRGGGS